MFLQNSQEKIEEEFLQLIRKLGADNEPLKIICEKLEKCDRDLTLAMKYLYVVAPYSDLVNYSFETIRFCQPWLISLPESGTGKGIARRTVPELCSGSQSE